MSYSKSLTEDIKKIIECFGWEVSVKEFSTSQKVNWFTVSYSYKAASSKDLSEEFLNTFSDKIVWQLVGTVQNLSEEMLDKHWRDIGNIIISSQQKLSDSAIIRFADRLSFFHLSFCQTLSEAIMEKFADKLEWRLMSEYQTFSEDFFIRFEKRIDKFSFQNNPCFDRLSDGFKNRVRGVK